MKINDKDISPGRAYIIADVGSNFNGSLHLAKEYIDAGKEIGLDAVKFQTYKAETLLNPVKPDGHRWAAYDVVSKHELPLEWHRELFEYAEKLDVEFITTPFSLEILDELNNIGLGAFKIASGDLTFSPLLEKIAVYGKPVILSTGMAYMEEIEEAVHILMKTGVSDIALLHCVSNYPPKYDHVNLKAIRTLMKKFDLPIGISDHTPDDTTALGAIALGASIVEKHITIDKNLGTPDALFAMTISEFEGMIKNIRNLEKALGDGVKRPADDELYERQWARRGIYAKKDVYAEEELTLEKVKFVRPIDGLVASEWASYNGERTRKEIKKDEPLREEHFHEK